MSKYYPALLVVIAFVLGWLAHEKYTEPISPAIQPEPYQEQYQEPIPPKTYPDLPSGGINDLRGET